MFIINQQSIQDQIDQIYFNLPGTNHSVKTPILSIPSATIIRHNLLELSLIARKFQ